MGKKEKKIYVFSTGRVGSTYISKILSSLIHDKMVVHQQKYARIINILGHMRLTGVLPKSLFSKFSNVFYKSELPVSTSDPLISVFISFYLNQFDKNDYKVLHLIRDPRDFVTSFMNWKNRKLSGLVAHHLTPFWQPNPFLAKEISFMKWVQMSKFEHYCWLWNYKNSFFYNNFKNSNNYKLIKLEDLTNSKATETWQLILDFLNIKNSEKISKQLFRKKVNPSEKIYFPAWKDWSNSQSRILNKNCGKLMLMFGYGSEKIWNDMINN
jgi:hypothetical protein